LENRYPWKYVSDIFLCESTSKRYPGGIDMFHCIENDKREVDFDRSYTALATPLPYIYSKKNSLSRTARHGDKAEGVPKK
jgi:hypothetical protein